MSIVLQKIVFFVYLWTVVPTNLKKIKGNEFVYPCWLSKYWIQVYIFMTSVRQRQIIHERIGWTNMFVNRDKSVFSQTLNYRALWRPLEESLTIVQQVYILRITAIVYLWIIFTILKNKFCNVHGHYPSIYIVRHFLILNKIIIIFLKTEIIL